MTEHVNSPVNRLSDQQRNVLVTLHEAELESGLQPCPLPLRRNEPGTSRSDSASWSRSLRTLDERGLIVRLPWAFLRAYENADRDLSDPKIAEELEQRWDKLEPDERREALAMGYMMGVGAKQGRTARVMLTDKGRELIAAVVNSGS
jgi:hypothetical protein